MKITKAILEGKGACPRAIEVFAQEWPDGAEVTLENCRRAVALGLNLAWAVKNLLSPPAWADYDEARDCAKDCTWADYEEAMARAFYEAMKGENYAR